MTVSYDNLIGPMCMWRHARYPDGNPDVRTRFCDNKVARIIPRHLKLAIRNDEELIKLLSGVTTAQGRVLPNNIQAVLLPIRTEKKA